MKTFPVILKLSISTLLENRLRSILTLTGMVFGTAAVIATLSSNSGAQKYISQQLANLGTKLMTATLRSGEITPSDLVVLTRYIPDIDAAVLEKKIPNVPVRQKLTEITSSAYAVDQGFFKAVGLSISNGRDFTDFDYQYPETNVILGYKLRESLFGLKNPYIGTYILAKLSPNPVLLKVIGSFKEKGSAAAEYDNGMFMTNVMIQKLVMNTSSSKLLVLLKNDEKSGAVKNQIESLMQPKFGANLVVSDAREALERTQSIWAKQNFVGLCLAGVSLLTGGVGIMNIMILSIHQRRKEIGLRKAVGARNSEIALQFLLETIIICLIGGLIGVGVGWGFGQKVATMLGDWEAETSFFSIILALGFSVFVGIIFGMVPAIRASKIDPYDALRTG
jgi:putative ABC transport system permease protein